MTSGRRGALVGLVATLLLLASVSSASASRFFYVAPAGTGTLCTSGAKCQLTTAMSLLSDFNDTINAEGGVYNVTAGLTASQHITILGNSIGGPDEQTILDAAGDTDTAHAVLTLEHGGQLDNVTIRNANAQAGLEAHASALVTDFVGLNDTLVTGAETTGPLCTFSTSVNKYGLSAGGSACIATGLHAGTAFQFSSTAPQPGPGPTIALGDDTFSSSGLAQRGLVLSASSTGITGSVVNTIVRGGAFSTGISCTAGVALTSSHNDLTETDCAGITGDGTTITAVPLLDSDGWHELAGSPTIGAGHASGNPLSEIDGDLFEAGGHRDIGADQRPPAPLAETNSAIFVNNVSAEVRGGVTSDGGNTTAHFEYGTTTAYGSVTGPIPAYNNPTTKFSVSTTVQGLSPGTTYHFRVVATNQGGAANGTDMTFTTGGGPGPTTTTTTTTGPPPKPPITGPGPIASTAAKLSHVTAAGTHLKFSLSRDATVTVRIQLRHTGHRRGKTCSTTARHGRSCTKYTTIFTKTVHAKQGINTVVFAHRRPKHGHYRVTLTAVAGGVKSPAVTKSFTE